VLSDLENSESHFATESVRYFHRTAARGAVATELLLTWQLSVETLEFGAFLSDIGGAILLR
jgi:hypothetical protein